LLDLVVIWIPPKERSQATSVVTALARLLLRAATSLLVGR